MTAASSAAPDGEASGPALDDEPLRPGALDDAGARARIDPGDALGDVEATARQWRDARELASVTADLDGVDVVVVAGMGGSGIAGDVVAAVGADVLALPVVVHKGYGLPAFVGPRTLLLAVSYSGNTEETLSAVDVAVRRQARVLAVSSGGALGDAAERHGFPLVRVPGGGQPRHSLGSLAVPLLAALRLDGDLDEAIAVLEQVAAAWGRDVPLVDNRGKQLGRRLADASLPVVYGGQGLAAVAALRLKCQLNENAKLPALLGTLPELDHNDVVGWERPPAVTGSAGLLWLWDDGAGERNRRRLEVTDAIVGDALAWSETVASTGRSTLARLAGLLLRADLISVYAALARGVDPTPVASIDTLKRSLAS